MRSRLLYAGFGLVATIVGMATGHFVASLLDPASSPVLAVGSAVIDLTPTPVKEWAVARFGTADKPILIGSVLVGVLILAAVAGLLALKRFAYGAVMLVVLVGAAATAVLTRPSVAQLDVVPSIVTALAGLAALWFLHRKASGQALRPARSTSASAPETGKRNRLVLGDADPSASGTGTAGQPDVAVPAKVGKRRADSPTDVERPAPSRRGVLIAMGALTAAAAVLGGAGRFIIGLRTRPEDIALPEVAQPLAALPKGLDGQVPGITPFVTSNEDFYRVDTRLDTPVVESEGWTLTVDGDVENELTITFDELLAMPMVERDITMTCVSNSVGGKFVGAARWQGVLLKDILDMAGVGDKADQILSEDFDGMLISTPLELATDGRDAMIVVGMNGEALPREHGFPVRMIIPGLYGFISGTKWLTKLTLTTYAEQTSYWTDRDWGTDAPIKISARIDTPKALEQVKAGKVIIGGVAWAQQSGGVAKVQVQIDGGGWQDAELGADGGNDYWRQWFYEWEADAGSHNIAARVVDGNGETQTATRAAPFPDGASGIQTLIVTGV